MRRRVVPGRRTRREQRGVVVIPRGSFRIGRVWQPASKSVGAVRLLRIDDSGDRKRLQVEALQGRTIVGLEGLGGPAPGRAVDPLVGGLRGPALQLGGLLEDATLQRLRFPD